ncbi:hypothetical protein NEOLEDRAFT_1103202 [Neolentinus lepideus HHB14362 ss-1]|uniref:Ubiquitin-like protease family profile domain-containing protein n=1 Tax=Neolentinus lepideus HHB14362 ss-1 TaxID=1314782 RepID=A0A165MST3_9AGAM|nr:hypothetical protein NEOLEDRAFT_1103202 [Neolentinus lepideus HHB14362 ss-1]
MVWRQRSSGEINGGLGHWTLAIVHLPFQSILHFDSFADEETWRDDSEDVFKMIWRLADLASMTINREGWISRPVMVSPVQRNGYDCGIWILACMAAVFRGFDAISLDESDIARF